MNAYTDYEMKQFHAIKAQMEVFYKSHDVEDHRKAKEMAAKFCKANKDRKVHRRGMMRRIKHMHSEM